jgi:hypothetical protein
MDRITNNRETNIQQPFIVPKGIFAALSPLDQLAAKALEKCGKVKIVEDPDREFKG